MQPTTTKQRQRCQAASRTTLSKGVRRCHWYTASHYQPPTGWFGSQKHNTTHSSDHALATCSCLDTHRHTQGVGPGYLLPSTNPALWHMPLLLLPVLMMTARAFGSRGMQAMVRTILRRSVSPNPTETTLVNRTSHNAWHAASSIRFIERFGSFTHTKG